MAILGVHARRSPRSAARQGHGGRHRCDQDRARQGPGRVIDTELRSRNGKLVWEIDIASAEGEFTEVDVDANTGVIADSE